MGLSLRVRGALGLRGRIIGVVLVTAVVTLAVAAVALLGPLENSLRKAEQRTLSHALGADPARNFRILPLGRAVTDDHGEDAKLGRAETQLANQIGGGVVTVLFPGTARTDLTPANIAVTTRRKGMAAWRRARRQGFR